jgi:hypothetical protein
MAVRTCSARRQRVRRRTRVETHARAKIQQQQHFGSPPSTAIRSPVGHEHQTRHDSRQRPKRITTHGRPPHALRQGERSGGLGRQGILRDDLARWGDRPRGAHPPRNYAGRDPRMMSPAWLLDILAALMLVVAAVSATASLPPGCQPTGFRRLSRPGPARRRVVRAEPTLTSRTC